MTGPNTALALMVRPSKPTRGATHILLEDIADSLFRGPAKIHQGVDLLVRDAQAECLSQAKALDRIPEIAVPHMLEGADGAAGMIVFDGALVDALIEQQTLGRISAAPRVDRPVTAIDAALSTGFAKAVVAKLAEVCAERRDAAALSGFTCGAPQTDRAALSLALPAKSYDVLQLSVDLGPGVKTGRALLMFPAVAQIVKPKPKSINPAMVALLQDCPLSLVACLPRVRLPVATLLGLAPDVVIPLPDDILTRTQLRDSRGATLGSGRLGQFNGRRALRLDGLPAAPGRTALASMLAPQLSDGVSADAGNGSSPEEATADLPAIGATSQDVIEPTALELAGQPT